MTLRDRSKEKMKKRMGGVLGSHNGRCVRFTYVKVKVKVKFTLEQATKAQRGSRGIAQLFP
jgi:hypothetical protein